MSRRRLLPDRLTRWTMNRLRRGRVDHGAVVAPCDGRAHRNFRAVWIELVLVCHEARAGERIVALQRRGLNLPRLADLPGKGLGPAGRWWRRSRRQRASELERPDVRAGHKRHELLAIELERGRRPARRARPSETARRSPQSWRRAR